MWDSGFNLFYYIKEILSRGFYTINIFFARYFKNKHNLQFFTQRALRFVQKTQNCPIGYTPNFRSTSQSLSLLEKLSFQHFHTTFPQVFRFYFVQFAQVIFSTFFDIIQQHFHPAPVENSVETVQNLEKQRLFPQGFPKRLWKTLSSPFWKIIFLCTFFCVFNKRIKQGKIANQYPSEEPEKRSKIFLAISAGKTSNARDMVNRSSLNERGTVLSTLPPRYTKPICTDRTAIIISTKALFRPSPLNISRESVLALKQLKTDAKMNSAKKAVRR